MDNKKVFQGIVLMVLFAVLGASGYAADQTQAQSMSPTNVVLDYDLTHVDANLRPGG